MHSAVRGSEAVISVIMPAYNEGENIFENLVVFLDTMEKLALPYEIIIVNDGSTDNTKAEILRFQASHPSVKFVSYDVNRGKGHALKEGWKAATGKYLTFIDSDLEIHPNQIKFYFDEIERTQADIIIGSKRHERSVINYPKKRRILSKCYNLLIRTLFRLNISDTQPGFKMMRKEAADDVFGKMVVKRYAFDLELLMNAIRDGYSIVEAPIVINFLRANGGRIKISDIGQIFRDTMGIFFRLYITHYYDKVTPVK
ncbi:MAG: Glycosyltransferase AglD [Methanomassiliicoccales archaeon PtaU1.Bin124]|nr:MAG: Glycosyltransferase AglD [Methanomassiliicoccales archaeon PtaU1.Bin124]